MACAAASTLNTAPHAHNQIEGDQPRTAVLEHRRPHPVSYARPAPSTPERRPRAPQHCAPRPRLPLRPDLGLSKALMPVHLGGHAPIRPAYRWVPDFTDHLPITGHGGPAVAQPVTLGVARSLRTCTCTRPRARYIVLGSPVMNSQGVCLHPVGRQPVARTLAYRASSVRHTKSLNSLNSTLPVRYTAVVHRGIDNVQRRDGE